MTATNADGNKTATSVPTAVVQPAPTTPAPTNTSPPKIAGTAKEGQTLTADKGSWSGTDPISYAYAWQRCDSSGGQCSSIGGATQTVYKLQSADIGHTLRIAVTASNPGGGKTSTSVPTAVVVSATPAPAPTGCTTNGGTVQVAGIASPARLNIDQFQVNPSSITYTTRTVTARFHVSACGGSVQGALIYATAVPYNMFNVPNEQATGSDGWATLTFTALPGFPVSKNQQLLVMFVRGRKPGEPVLGGISTRRLISFRVTRS